MPACFIHSDAHFPMAALEVHHKHPTAYGGPDTPDNRCLLCASCHAAVHRIAIKAYSRQVGVAKDILEQYLPGQPQRQERLWKLVQTVVQARTTHTRSTEIPDAGLDGEDDEDTVKVSLDMPNWLHHRLKTLATGRNGLYKYIMTVLANHAMVATKKPGATKEELYAYKELEIEPQPDTRHQVDFTKL